MSPPAKKQWLTALLVDRVFDVSFHGHTLVEAVDPLRYFHKVCEAMYVEAVNVRSGQGGVFLGHHVAELSDRGHEQQSK